MHVHAHGGSGPKRVLKISLGVTLAYIALLVVSGIRAHSLALLSEAGHNLSDFLALLLSLVAVYLQSRPASSTKTYGYHRAGVLGGEEPLRNVDVTHAGQGNRANEHHQRNEAEAQRDVHA